MGESGLPFIYSHVHFKVVISFLDELGTAFGTGGAEMNSTQISSFLSHDRNKHQ